MNSGCLEECVLVLLSRKGQLGTLVVDDIPDLWAEGLAPFEWEAILSRWIKTHTGQRLRRWGTPPRETEVIAVGWSPRDPERVRHAVLMIYPRAHVATMGSKVTRPLDQPGKLLYDPHSSGAGVIRPNSFYWW